MWEMTTVAISRLVSKNLLTHASFRRARSLCATFFNPQRVPLPAERMNQFDGGTLINLTAESGNIHLNDVAEFFPVVIVKVFEQFCLRHHCARAVRQVFE